VPIMPKPKTCSKGGMWCIAFLINSFTKNKVF
jgi:hypothetical protein